MCTYQILHLSIKAGGIFCALEVIKSLQLKPPGNGSHPAGCTPDCFDKHHLFMHSKPPEWKAFQRWCQIITEVSKNVLVFYNKMIYQA